MTEQSAEAQYAERLRTLANELDLHSFSINDGYVGRIAEALSNLADEMATGETP